jgi:HD-like signal output (HDOD) protein
MSTPQPTPRPIEAAQVLKAAGALGVLGAGARSWPRLLAALSNPAISASEVASLIDQEPTMYARVLRVANSPYYGQTRSITTVDRALLVLGLDAVRGIAAATCFDRTLSRGKQATVIDMQAVVHHSLATAAAAERLAQIQHRSLAAEAFIAGLLHNLGVAVQLQVDSRGVEAMLEARAANPTLEIRRLESDFAAIGHERCVGILFEEWRLPAALVAVGLHHHAPEEAPAEHRDLTCLVNLAATLALASGNTFLLEPLPVARNPVALAQLKFDDAALDAIEAELPERVRELKLALLGA